MLIDILNWLSKKVVKNRTENKPKVFLYFSPIVTYLHEIHGNIKSNRIATSGIDYFYSSVVSRLQTLVIKWVSVLFDPSVVCVRTPSLIKREGDILIGWEAYQGSSICDVDVRVYVC